MIVTAAFLLATSYELCHNDNYTTEDAGWSWFLFLGVFMYFDYSMAQVIA